MVGKYLEGKTLKVWLNRGRLAEDTFNDLKPLIKRAGITRLADITGLDRLGIPVVLAVRPNSSSLAVAQGKGLDLLSAKISGAMEALETYHAERLDWPLRLLRWSDIVGTPCATEVERLPMRHNTLFDAEKRLPWVTAVDLVTGETKLVPLELVHTDFTLPFPPGSGCFSMSSNGLASGNSFPEAITHGLCELVERHAHTLFPGAGNCKRVVDLSSATDPRIQQLAHQLSLRGCELLVEDLTPDFGIPVFFASISGGAESFITTAPAGGFGCHPDRDWACLRAILEAAQARLTRLSGARDDLRPKWFASDGLRNFGRHDGHSNKVQFESLANLRTDIVEEDLDWLIQRLGKGGFTEILVVDLSRPDFGLPVVRVIVPGLLQPLVHQ